jgi:dihydrofolate synthase/folylpolyglutamate synthase
MLSSVLMASGLKVGLYTSPYIVEFGERIRINGESIPKDKLISLVEEIKPIAEAMTDKPTEFELITAIAFLYYMREGVDIVVLEVGLGGRLDSTNIIKSPIASIITGISLDHTAILGDTVEAIAYEKAGIIKHGSTVISGCRDKSANAVISQAAKERGAEFCEADYSLLTVKESNLEGTVFDYKTFKEIKISLLGSYQPRNAAIVLECVSLLREAGYTISDDALREGMNSARWHARFEIISKDPRVIFDGAHNPEGIEAATESIKAYLGGERVYLISGVLRDKDYTRIAETVSEVVMRAYTITPQNPRALSAEEYSEVLRRFGVEAITVGDIEAAVRLALKDARADGATLVCLGSLYTYGEIIKYINEGD